MFTTTEKLLFFIFFYLPWTRVRLHSGTPGLCPPCSPHCYATGFSSDAWDQFYQKLNYIWPWITLKWYIVLFVFLSLFTFSRDVIILLSMAASFDGRLPTLATSIVYFTVCIWIVWLIWFGKQTLSFSQCHWEKCYSAANLQLLISALE